ncbi:E3 ubiquitin-protein ligase TRIM39 isoform X2 [Ictalurus punctatus]|uniref:E3 ubiquitin-protein ligase TRIM39 isoform X2 n=1 Tax=Ictalurus punctatus TaxID=7998 RepID=A0A9F7RL33_ICTPU|nr:E3 ubiquitin-protein ligase TRIM39 isoform X2 [Ictalurus punctatus]
MAESLSSQLRQGRRKSMDTPTDCESSSFLTKEQLQCPICLEVFTDPVTTPCGHNFCNSCLKQSWDTSQYYYCPYCKEKFTKRPEIKINITLREVADCFKKKTVSDKSQILCDFCTDVKQEALKSCLDCCVTLCSSHLESHNNVPKYKKHKVINAVGNLEKYICQEHERPLELFCRDDQKCVCRFCAVTDHKNHKVNPIEEESGQRKSQLGKTQTELQQMIQERLKKIQEINHSVELSKRNTEKETSDSIEVFTALIRSIERSQAELLEVMEEKQKAAEKQAEGLIKELEQEIDELKRRDTELELLSHTDDHLHLLQIYPSLCIAPHTKNWTEIRINTELSEKALKKTLSQLQKTLNEKLSVTLNEKLSVTLNEKLSVTLNEKLRVTLNKKLKEKVPTELKRFQQYAVDVTLDPDTANPLLILSDDGKQVQHGKTKQNLPDTPKRFTKYAMVLGNQGFSSGRFYYEVQVSGETEWDLGVARESVNRKGKISLKPQTGFWTVVLRNGNEYTACEDPCISLSLRKKPQKVGVFVDYDEGLVTFYDVEARSHIYSFTGQCFTEKLYPYFSPSKNDGGKNSAPLIISRV